MDFLIEQTFVNTFIYKNMRARFLYELRSGKLREHCIHRFCHGTEKYIKADVVHSCTSKHSIQSLLEQIRMLSPSETCYILSQDDTFDGRIMSLRQAVGDTFYEGMAVLLIIDAKTAVIKEEQMFGPPMRYILNTAKA